MKIPTFPQVIFIKVEQDSDGSEYMNPCLTKFDALDGLDPVRVGMYKFIETHEIRPALPLWKKLRSRKTR
jgi:hypothetical protein